MSDVKSTLMRIVMAICLFTGHGTLACLFAAALLLDGLLS